MNRKIKLLALISIAVVLAAVATSLVLATQSTVKADTTTAVASDVTSPLAVNASNNVGFFNNRYMGFGGPGGGLGGHRGMSGGFCGNFSRGMMPIGFGSIQVSSDYTRNVTNILQNDPDVQNLLNQGYNVTSIRPVITSVIDGNGNVVTQATTVDVILQSATGRALVIVDLTSASVTKIVTTTTTVINK
jgi:hypothetical protein